MPLNESIVEAAALSWFSGLGFTVGHGPEMVQGEPRAARSLLVGRFLAAIRRMNLISSNL